MNVEVLFSNGMCMRYKGVKNIFFEEKFCIIKFNSSDKIIINLNKTMYIDYTPELGGRWE